MAETLGRLDPMQRRELEQLAKKTQSGEQLSNAELQRIEQLGGSSVREFTSQQFQQRGAGFTDILSPFTQQQQQRESSLERQRDVTRDIVAETEREVEELAKANREQQKEVADRILKLMSDQFANAEQLRILEERLQNSIQSGGG